MRTKDILSLLFLLFTIPMYSQYAFNFVGSSGTNIVDYGIKTLEKEITIPESVNKLTVTVDIEHSWVSDLEMTITNPDGDQFTVFSNLGVGECFACDGDDISIEFEDASSLSYFDLNQQCNDKPAFSGSSKALLSLDSILLGNINGLWIIEIKDLWPHESGRINSIVLEFGNYEAPLCTEFTAPIEGQDTVEINSIITWNPAENATGYLLSLGTESGVYDLLNNYDVGNLINFNPGILECDQDYFIRVIPYNPFGEAIDCLEQFFHTEYVEAGSSEDLTICLGESAQLQASGGSIYSWIPDTFLDDPNIPNPISTPEESIQYTLIVMNDNGCSDTTTVSITVPLIEIIVDSVYHARTDLPGFILISDNGPDGTYLYEWSGPNGFSANTQDIDSLEVGCYTLLVTDVTTGCTAETIICIEDLTNVPIEHLHGEIIIYPNPVLNFVTIDFLSKEKEDFEVYLFNTSGKKVGKWFKAKDSRYLQIDMSSFAQGIYEMNCISGDFIHKARLFRLKD